MQTPQEFAWNVACKIAEMVSDGDENDVKPEDITVTVDTDTDGIMEPTIEYTQYGYTWRATLTRTHSAGLHNLDWQEV